MPCVVTWCSIPLFSLIQMLKFVLYILNLIEWKWVSSWVCDWFWRYALRALSLSVFRSWSILYRCTCSSCQIILSLHLFNKVLWCLTDMTRSVRCNISSAGQWLYICRCRYPPLGVGCCCRASGCSLLGCCRSNRWLYCGSSGCSLYRFWGWWSGDRLSSHLNLGVHVRLDSIWVMFTNVVSCSFVLSSINDFVDVWAMIACTTVVGSQCPVIVDYRNRLSYIEWGFLAVTCMVMVSCTLGCMFL